MAMSESLLLKIFRMFTAFRRLETEHRREADRAIELQTRMAEQGNTIEWLRRKLEEATDRERRATQTMANIAMQLKFGAIPFPEAQSIPEPEVTPDALTPPPPEIVQGSALKAKQAADFRSQLDKYFEEHGVQ